MPSLFLFGFLFSSAVSFSLAGGAAAQIAALVHTLAVLFYLDSIVVIFRLDCNFNILTMAYYVFNESSGTLQTWPAQSRTRTSLARPVSS